MSLEASELECLYYVSLVLYVKQHLGFILDSLYLIRDATFKSACLTGLAAFCFQRCNAPWKA